MKISMKTVAEKLIWLLTIFLFTSFQLFNTTNWGRYAFFGASILIVLLSAVAYDGVIRIRIQAYHIFFVLFIGYTAMTSLWAVFRPVDASNKSITLLQIFGCAAMLYLHYERKGHIRDLLSAVKWSGFLVTLYAIAFYGLDAMLESAQDIRLENEFNNVNAIAIAAALSCMLLWDDLMRRKNLWAVVLLVPAVVLITATQSRKAFVMLLAGVFGIYIMHAAKQKGLVKKMFRLLIYAVVVFVGLRLLFRLPIFSGSLERMDQLLNFWSQEGDADHSTIMRNDMVELGIEWWKEHPLLGIGIGNPHVLSATYLKFDAYLHNNYVELLCGGGIVAVLIYYGMYVYLLISLFRYRKADPDAFGIALIWMALLLVMDYGMVTYYTKTQWYYLLIHFINVSNMKEKYREMMENAQEPSEEGNEVPELSGLPVSDPVV